MTVAGHPGLYAPLRLVPEPSRALAGLLVSIHLVAALALAALALYLSVTGPGAVLGFAIAAGLAASIRHAWRLHVSRSHPGAVTEALWDAEGHWWLRLADGDPVRADLQPDSLVTRHLIVLNFCADGPIRAASLVLIIGALSPDRLRRLRVRLRLAHRAPSGTAVG